MTPGMQKGPRRAYSVSVPRALSGLGVSSIWTRREALGTLRSKSEALEITLFVPVPLKLP